MVEKVPSEQRQELFPPYFALTADSQQQGRGRQGKSWESETGKNLLLSLLLYPRIPPSLQFHVCRQVSLGIAKWIKETFDIEQVFIKWPNDIYIENKKLVGILIEHFLLGDSIHYSIAGIGININQTSFSASLPNPTSIFLETQKTNSIEDCLHGVIEKIKQTEMLSAEILEKQYMNCLYQYNVFANYMLPKISPEPLLLKIVGVHEKGMLQLEDTNRHLYSCAFNEVVYLI